MWQYTVLEVVCVPVHFFDRGKCGSALLMEGCVWQCTALVGVFLGVGQ